MRDHETPRVRLGVVGAAYAVGRSRATIYRWRSANPEAFQAVETGKGSSYNTPLFDLDRLLAFARSSNDDNLPDGDPAAAASAEVAA